MSQKFDLRRFYLLYGHILSENPAQEKSATLLRISGDRAISETASRKFHRHCLLNWQSDFPLLGPTTSLC